MRRSYIDYLVNLSNPPNHQDIIKVANKLCLTLEDDTKFETFGMSLLDTTSTEDVKMILLECQGKPPDPVAKYKRLLDVWKEHTPESKCRWEKVRDVLNKMDFKRLAEAMVISGSQDDQSNGTGTIHLGTETVSEGRSSSQPNENSCLSEYSLLLNNHL